MVLKNTGWGGGPVEPQQAQRVQGVKNTGLVQEALRPPCLSRAQTQTQTLWMVRRTASQHGGGCLQPRGWLPRAVLATSGPAAWARMQHTTGHLCWSEVDGLGWLHQAAQAVL